MLEPFDPSLESSALLTLVIKGKIKLITKAAGFRFQCGRGFDLIMRQSGREHLVESQLKKRLQRNQQPTQPFLAFLDLADKLFLELEKKRNMVEVE